MEKTHLAWKIQRPTTIYESQDQAIIVIFFDEGTYYSLEHKTYVLWKLLELGLSTFQIVAFFEKTVHTEIYSLLHEMEADGLIQHTLEKEPSVDTLKESIDKIRAIEVDHSHPLQLSTHSEQSYQAYIEMIGDDLPNTTA